MHTNYIFVYALAQYSWYRVLYTHACTQMSFHENYTKLLAIKRYAYTQDIIEGHCMHALSYVLFISNFINCFATLLEFNVRSSYRAI